MYASFFFFFQAEDGIRDYKVTGVQTCALPISLWATTLSHTSTSVIKACAVRTLVEGRRGSATRRRSGREARGAGTSGGGGGRGARVPRRERASGQQALVWRGHGSDDDCGGHRVPRRVSVRGADAGRRQQNDVVVVAVVPEAGDPAGIGRTGIGEGREQHHRAHE